MTIPLEQLLKATTRKREPEEVFEVQDEATRRELAVVRRQARARLVAQEYVRNGMSLTSAWETVTHKPCASRGVYQLFGAQTDLFFDEVSKLVDRSDIDRDHALGILWGMFNTSILDFFDDHGRILPISELKKLPRVMQLMLSKIEIHEKQVAVLDENRRPMVDDNGVPYLRAEQHVKIEIPEKMASIQQLAQLMRWVGPTTQVVFNVGALMTDAEDRAKTIGRVYENAPPKRLD